jgi:outer membrane protein assembly factor BamA
VNLTVVRQVSQFQSASLSYQIADREIHEYRAGDLASGEIDLLTFLTQVAQGALDSLGSSVKSSTFTLSGITGKLDHAANPRLGIILRPAVQVTAPNRWSSTSFWRADVSANAFLPVQRHVTLAARGTFGRLFPFGKSVPAPGEDPTNKFLQLRDVMFTAGGTGDVRGWENRLLGPKVPDIRFTSEPDTNGDGRPELIPHTDSYVPLGGLERLSFSVELQVPLPGMGPNFGGHVFLDGGRVRTTDHRFDLQQGAHGQENMFYATGAGVDIRTPVGPIKMGVGYKLNPSLTDLVDPAVLLRGAAEGKPLDTLPREQSRRWQFYLAIGASY